MSAAGSEEFNFAEWRTFGGINFAKLASGSGVIKDLRCRTRACDVRHSHGGCRQALFRGPLKNQICLQIKKKW